MAIGAEHQFVLFVVAYLHVNAVLFTSIGTILNVGLVAGWPCCSCCSCWRVDLGVGEWHPLVKVKVFAFSAHVLVDQRRLAKHLFAPLAAPLFELSHAALYSLCFVHHVVHAEATAATAGPALVPISIHSQSKT
ncbi:hypothetical protein BpHYR1_000134 [Brachionus plicatilis]|uniref:Uncharacterized protein n=1 Tax=Brachionus plicatilis TaxID=10195 RepID=A0A3M7SCZ9_BRAPC|nr:hypothetical protein BpHYR1_000134 [Brachionus plicatilis]